MSARTIAEQPQAHAEVRPNASQRVLLYMIIAAVGLGAAIALSSDVISEIYLRNQATNLGYVVNGSIIALFLFGMLRMARVLLYYSREETALGALTANLRRDGAELMDGVDKTSLIHQRHDALVLLNRQHAPVNHSALAATLVATESTRTSVPRFINNVLILTGVFGTIAALSVALLGASQLLRNEQDFGGMDLLVHGMSTALSTTITAIVCYLIFAYFFLKLSDVQTKLVAGIEQATTLHLLPRFETRPESIVSEVADLVFALRGVTENMQSAQRNQAALEQQVGELVESQAYYLANISNRLNSMRQLLREGFRLPLPDDEEK